MLKYTCEGRKGIWDYYASTEQMVTRRLSRDLAFFCFSLQCLPANSLLTHFLYLRARRAVRTQT